MGELVYNSAVKMGDWDSTMAAVLVVATAESSAVTRGDWVAMMAVQMAALLVHLMAAHWAEMMAAV